jgi:predicted Fe-Mo cluster-binding NifX family protein
MRIALPTNGSDIDEHFGHCQSFTIFHVDDQRRIVSEETLAPPPGCGCKSNVIPQLAGMGVSVMLAGHMGDGAVHMLASNGIRVVRGCSGDAREAAQSWLAGKLADSGAGCPTHGLGGCPGHP